MRYSNPRRSAVIEDWPSGRHRVRAEFIVQSKPDHGERVSRITEKPKGGQGKPKCTTYGQRFTIVDGDDGCTYLLEYSHYGQVIVWPGTLKETRYLSDNEHSEERAHVLELLGIKELAS